MKYEYEVGDICLDDEEREWHEGDYYFLAEHKDPFYANYSLKKYFGWWGDRLKEYKIPNKKGNQYIRNSNSIDLTIFGVTGAALSALAYFFGI